MIPVSGRRRFHQELDLLQARVMSMAGLAEDLVSRGVRAFLARDPGARDTIGADDGEIDRLEIEVDDEVMRLVARYQPVAGDLRQILTSLKISNDIERVGDHAVNLAKAARRVSRVSPLPEIPEFEELALLAQRMLRDSLAAFSSRNSSLARQVCTRDDRVDDMHGGVREILVGWMEKDPSRLRGALEFLRASQQLERIGDLSTNISEEVVFLVEGCSIKHNLERRADRARPVLP
jgi:phosphate transport system protein